MRAWRSVIGALIATSVACGGKVVFVEETDPPEPPDPPLSSLCQAARDSVDWSPCAELSYDPWVHAGRYCQNQSAVPACRAAAEAYYGCIADTGGVCVAVVDEANGSESTGVDIPECELALEEFSACLSECGAPSVCPDSPEVCECDSPSLLEGTACCWYPTCPADGSVPSCFEVCGSCEAAS